MTNISLCSMRLLHRGRMPIPTSLPFGEPWRIWPLIPTREIQKSQSSTLHRCLSGTAGLSKSNITFDKALIPTKTQSS